MTDAMFGTVHIGPVPLEARAEAVRFLVAGRRRDVLAASRAEAFEAMIASRRPEQVRLWHAVRWRKRVAAALVLENPGKTGFLFYSPPAAAGVDADALGRAIQAASRTALADGLSLVQSLVAPDATRDVALLCSVGYERLAELIYMRLDLDREPPGDAREDLVWRSWAEYGEAELSALIAATYEGSLDCPRLSGARRTADVIEGHKASGIFRPESWWLVYRSGFPAGCILVNDSTTPGVAEVVYMGVAPAQRGAGVGRSMLRKAARTARDQALSALTLAVDSGNVHAKNLYDSEGFREVDRRLAYAMIQPRAGF